MIEVILASKSERKKESENFKSITRDYSRSISNRESNSGYEPKISFSYGWDYEKKLFKRLYIGSLYLNIVNLLRL